MNRTKSIFLTIISLVLMNISIFALPGVTQKIQDKSGQFVYYKDSTFERESYIGVIYFDESTYGLRYYAPALEKQGKPEIKMQVYITIDVEKAATKGIIDFTGEKVEPLPHSQEETDIINYLHNFAYDMFPKRIFYGNLDKKVSVNDDYEQFGGKVSIEYNPIIPILNLNKITSSDGKIMLEAITGGQLVSSEDASFFNFKGIPSKINTKKSDKIKKGKNLPIEIKNDNIKTQIFEIDSNWEQKNTTIWTLSKNASIMAVSLSIPSDKTDAFIRSSILGRANSYPDWTKQKITQTNGDILLNQIIYNSDSDSFNYDFKNALQNKENVKTLFNLTVSADAYSKNKGYFDNILKSNKLK